MAILKLIIFSAIMIMAASADSKLYPQIISSEGIVGDGLIKMCVGMWDGANGLTGFLERLTICSKVAPLTR